MNRTAWLVALSLSFSSLAYCESASEIAAPRKVGHLTQIGASKFIDLGRVTTIEGYIVAIAGQQFWTYPLTEDGVKRATEFIASGQKKAAGLGSDPAARTIKAAAGVRFDGQDHSLFSIEKTSDTFDPESTAQSLKQSLSFFTELLKLAQ